jgi:2'-5' RNA ligase
MISQPLFPFKKRTCAGGFFFVSSSLSLKINLRSNKMRLFIAIDLPPQIKRELADIQAKLKKANAVVRWVSPDGIHLTLKFLSEVADDKVAGVVDALAESVPRISPFTLEVAGLGVFPSLSRPRVIWTGVKGAEGLMALAEEVEKAMMKLGFPREKRGFSPHLTLGRVKSPRGIDRLTKIIMEEKDISLGKFTADGYLLIRSILRPEGAEYIKIRKFNLF